MQAIVSGGYQDIFAVLGLHSHPRGKGFVVRVFLPGARQVDLVDRKQKKIASLGRIHDAGLFEAEFPRRRKRFDYLLRVDGSYTIEDQYRFPSQVDAQDVYLFNEGTHERNYQWMGAHARQLDGISGVNFVVWAPAAQRVSVVAEFNNWDGRRHVMRKHPGSGIWEIFIPGVQQYALYKYEIVDAVGRLLPLKADPYARSMQHPPDTASRVVLDEDFGWRDQDWMAARANNDPYAQPISIYEVHPGSWRRDAD